MIIVTFYDQYIFLGHFKVYNTKGIIFIHQTFGLGLKKNRCTKKITFLDIKLTEYFLKKLTKQKELPVNFNPTKQLNKLLCKLNQTKNHMHNKKFTNAYQPFRCVLKGSSIILGKKLRIFIYYNLGLLHFSITKIPRSVMNVMHLYLILNY